MFSLRFRAVSLCFGSGVNFKNLYVEILGAFVIVLCKIGSASVTFDLGLFP